MPLYQHRFMGHCAAGDQFVFSWWSDTSVSIDTSQSNAVAWVEALYAGASAGTGWASMTTADVGVDRVTTGEITLATGQQQALRETVTNLVGTAAVDALPAEVALVVSLRTPLANRSGRGRFYLPQPAVNTVDVDGTLDAAVQGQLADALAAAWTASNAAGENPVVYSRTNRSVQAITSFDVGDVFDVQTRRQNSLTQQRIARPMA
jgi:hypothetical protein